MDIITVCMGSSCFSRGNSANAEMIQLFIKENNLKDKVELCGAFCMKNCVNGVSVKVDEKLYSVKPDTVDEFFKNEILLKV